MSQNFNRIFEEYDITYFKAAKYHFNPIVFSPGGAYETEIQLNFFFVLELNLEVRIEVPIII